MKRIRIGSGLSRLLAPLGLAAALSAAPAAQAAEDLVLGGSIPLSGVFAFAGQGILLHGTGAVRGGAPSSQRDNIEQVTM